MISIFYIFSNIIFKIFTFYIKDSIYILISEINESKFSYEQHYLPISGQYFLISSLGSWEKPLNCLKSFDKKIFKNEFSQ